jgi:5-formyltetrahydrofolate cyclo-ligase
MITKGELRERALQARRGLSREELATLSQRVAQNLSSVPEFKEAWTIASYVAKEDEIQTAQIIERALLKGARVVVPRTESAPKRLRFYEIATLEELSPGNFGVLEPTAKTGRGSIPVALSESDVVLVPMVAWDERGNRIGYGKGYFDSELVSRRSSTAIGLALEVQRVEGVPSTERDVPMDVLVTETRVLRFPERRPGGPQSH